MNSATKLPGWNNGQYTSGGVTYTEQALDTSQGAGMLNMNQAMNQYIGGTLDPFGYAGSVQPTGWSLATVASGGYTDYTIDTELPANSYLDVTLCWFRDRAVPGVGSATGDWDPVTSALGVTDLGMAKLDLQIWDSTFTTLYAESDTSYNDVQELHYLLPCDGDYGIRVYYESQLFGTPDAGGETLGWRGTTRWWCQSLPTLACLAAAAMVLLAARRKEADFRSKVLVKGAGTVTATGDLIIGNSKQAGQFNQGGAAGIGGTLNVGGNALVILSPTRRSSAARRTSATAAA